jgi:PAS domain S-box-containing protein
MASDSAAEHSALDGQTGDVLERVSDAVVALDRDWRYTYVNRRAAELFGRRPEDLIGRHIWTEFPEGVGQPFHLAYERAMAEQRFIQLENYYEPWDRWFENRIYPSPDGLSIFFHEITDRKRAEQTARDNAALLEGQNRVLESIARGEPLERTLDMLLRFIESQCPEMLCSILLPADDDEHVRHGAAPSLPAAFTAALEGEVGSPCASEFARAALRPDVVIVEDVGSSPLWNDCRGAALAHGVRASWSSPILDARGEVLGTFAVYAERPGRPTERHRHLIQLATQTAATALVNQRETAARKASEERLRMAVTGGNVGIWEWDVVKDRFVLSDQLRTMFGWAIPTDDLSLADVMDRIHRDDRPAIEQALRRSVTLGIDFDVEYRVVGPRGVIRWLASKGGGEYAESSTPVRMMGVALDITTRKQAELELRRSDERFQLMARATNDAIWDWDRQTGALWWNQGIATLFAYADGSVDPTWDWRSARIHPADVAIVESGLNAVTSRGEQFWSGEFRFRRADGSYADVLDRVFVVYDAAGAPLRLIGAMTDISERKRALEVLEEAVASRTAQLHAKNRELEGEIAERRRIGELLRTRNEELKGFAYTVSHDLKAPLRGIAGYAQELQRRHATGLGDRATFCVDRILTATRSLDQLIEDLLRYARLEAETPTAGEVDLARLVDAILRDRQPAIQEYGAEVAVSLAVTRLRAWERGLAQAVANLIDNALKYSRHANPPRVCITTAALDDTFRLDVSDNGIGFDMKYHDRIFGLFNRLERQEDYEGTGAGLAIVKKVVEKMKGRVWADSAPGSGTAMHVDLPLDVPEEA